MKGPPVTAVPRVHLVWGRNRQNNACWKEGEHKFLFLSSRQNQEMLHATSTSTVELLSFSTQCPWALWSLLYQNHLTWNIAQAFLRGDAFSAGGMENGHSLPGRCRYSGSDIPRHTLWLDFQTNAESPSSLWGTGISTAARWRKGCRRK